MPVKKKQVIFSLKAVKIVLTPDGKAEGNDFPQRGNTL